MSERDEQHDDSDAPVHVILGATGGIGREVSARLARAGCRLVLGGRNGDRVGALAEELGAVAFTVDATQPDEVEACVAEAVSRFGRVDGAINCVGSLLLKPIQRTSPEEWRDAFRTNVDTANALVRTSVEAMRKGKHGGSIVLFSSAAARVGLTNHEAIAAAKAAVEGLAIAAAATHARDGIRVNCVAPGLTRSPLTESITSNELALKASLQMHALGRVGEPSDIASAVCWLVDPAQSWVTGQVIGVDGGLSRVRTPPATRMA